MTNAEMIAKVKAIYAEIEEEYTYIGLRFENKEREIGEICECSKHNVNREDERDFPEFGTDEYNQSSCLDGTSAWDLNGDCDEALDYNYRSESDREVFYEQEHCYIIAGNYNCNQDDGLDENEIVIEDAKVIAKIF